MAYKTFANGFPLPASDLNNFLMNQSVIVFASAAARTTTLPTPVEGMLTYLEDTNAFEGWTGAAWEAIAESPDLSGLIPKSTVTTAGDLIVADGASSVTRIGIGTADQILSVVAGTPAWVNSSAGSETLISTTDLASMGNSLTITGISQAYKHLRIRIINAKPDTDDMIGFRTKADTSNTSMYMSGTTNEPKSVISRNSTTVYTQDNVDASVKSFNAIINIYDYSSTTAQRKMQDFIFGYYSSDDPKDFAESMFGSIDITAAIDTFILSLLTGTTDMDSGTLEIWGIN